MTKLLQGAQLGLDRPANTQEIIDEYEAKCEPKNEKSIQEMSDEIINFEENNTGSMTLDELGVCFCLSVLFLCALSLLSFALCVCLLVVWQVALDSYEFSPLKKKAAEEKKELKAIKKRHKALLKKEKEKEKTAAEQKKAAAAHRVCWDGTCAVRGGCNCEVRGGCNCEVRGVRACACVCVGCLLLHFASARSSSVCCCLAGQFDVAIGASCTDAQGRHLGRRRV